MYLKNDTKYEIKFRFRLAFVFIVLFLITYVLYHQFLINEKEFLISKGVKSYRTIYKIEGTGKRKRVFYCYFNESNVKFCDETKGSVKWYVGQKFVVYYDQGYPKRHVLDQEIVLELAPNLI